MSSKSKSKLMSSGLCKSLSLSLSLSFSEDADKTSIDTYLHDITWAVYYRDMTLHEQFTTETQMEASLLFNTIGPRKWM